MITDNLISVKFCEPTRESGERRGGPRQRIFGIFEAHRLFRQGEQSQQSQFSSVKNPLS